MRRLKKWDAHSIIVCVPAMWALASRQAEAAMLGLSAGGVANSHSEGPVCGFYPENFFLKF